MNKAARKIGIVSTLGRDMTDVHVALDRAIDMLYAIQHALNTEETGEALVEVARNACRAEQELAARIRREESEQDFIDDCEELIRGDS